jgi:putative heme-binding domain-containing protein
MKPTVRRSLLAVAVAATLAGLCPLLASAQQKKDESKPLDEATILKSVKGPKGFDVTVFAMPPQVHYPTSVSATPNGELYVAIDEQGSLGKTPGGGRVIKAVDTDGDGKADKLTVFAKMEHPRGVYFDVSTDTLYVLHPPFLKAYRDTNGDGVADKEETLVSGIVTEKSQAARGADHTTNGFRLGIDGWIYVAGGDFGMAHAVGKDGTTLTIHGGGVARVRLDGSGLEPYSSAQRNIYDVAIDPLMNVYTRDNTNDGGGWDVRLSYIVPTGNYGYPSKFKNFQDEIIQPLADYGGGSPCGSLFLDEPGFPGNLGHGLYTVEWGRNAVYRHPLEPKGAGFVAKAEEFMAVPRGIDMDVDARGHLYVASWMNGSFSYSGPNVGYVVRLAPQGQKAMPAFPDLKKLAGEQVVGMLASPSAVTRQAVQREILRRAAKDGVNTLQPAVEKVVGSKESLPVRVAALFTLRQMAGKDANAAIVKYAGDDELKEFVLRALADVKNDASAPAGPFVQGLTDSNPRVRLVAAWGLGRLGKADAASQIVPLLADADPLVSHVAVNALVALHASDAALKVVDPKTPALVPGAIRVLQSMHETQVVDGLVEKLRGVQDPAVRDAIYRGLCRLYFREADWDGSWWGTRPDTSGPYYKTAEWDGTPRVRAVLTSALTSERPEVVRELVVAMSKNKVDFPELTAALQRLVAKDPSFKAVLVEMAGNRQTLSEADVALLREVAGSDKEPTELRVRALGVLQAKAGRIPALDAAVAVVASIVSAPRVDKALESAVNEFVRDNQFARQASYFTRLAEVEKGGKREVGFMVLVNLANNKLLQRDRRAQDVGKVIEAAWGKPEQAASLLRAIGRLKVDAYADKVAAAAKSANPQVASAARAAEQELAGKGSGSTAAAASSSSGTLIEKMPFERVVAIATKEKGDAAKGKEFFTKLGCVQCHTTSPEEAPKGPFLGGIATRYSRAQLCESILKPSAQIAQGFETQWFKTKDDDDYEGFVSREAGDELDVRNIVGVVTTLKKSEIKERGKREMSMMPEGLVAKLTPQDLACVLAYLESLKGK